MALAEAYSQVPRKRAVNTLIIAHFDAHGVAFAAARARVLRSRGEDVEIVSKFPETGPQGLSSGSLKQLVSDVAPQRIEIIDIPIDVRNPDTSVKTLADLAMVAPVYFYDHHETDTPFIPRLHQHGIYASVFGDGVAMAAALELLGENSARMLAIIGLVADRDSSVLKLVPREQVERDLLPIANRLDMVVRNPQQLGFGSLADFARELSEHGVGPIPGVGVPYPPEQLARDLQSKIVEEGTIAMLVDWSDQQPQQSMWTPKTLEQVLLLRQKHIAIAVCSGYNPRTRAIEGYDVRVLRYWLAPPDTPVPETLVKDLIAQRAITGNVVGHADYVSIRYPSLEQAMNVARTIYRRIEGLQPRTVHLVNDAIVASAIRRDFQTILEKITELLETQRQMYQEYLELKRRQVELLERTQRHEYD